MHLMPLHALESHPDVGLDVLHDVANVKFAVGVRQSRGDKQLAARCLGHDWGYKRGKPTILWPVATLASL
jgi:hypothetical protein